MRSNTSLAVSAAAILIGMTSLGSAHAQSPAQVAPTRNVYSFPHGYTFPGGYTPSSELTADRAGNLYGVSRYGGGVACPCGSVYRLVPPAAKGQAWTLQTLYSFANDVAGREPTGKPLLDPAGNIYGIAGAGGVGGAGTVWELSPPSATGGQWTLAVLHSFATDTAGATPSDGLVMDRSGTLYGVTEAGGTLGNGVVYSLAPPTAGETAWTETVLHDFGGPNEGQPGSHNRLALAPDQRTLTGVSGPYVGTHATGYYGGLVYRLRREANSWTYAVIYRFGKIYSSDDGYNPQNAVLVDRNNNVFGVTQSGGASGYGTVFELSPPAPGQTAWTEQVLHSFTDADGEYPVSGLISGGLPTSLFGTTIDGGEGGAVDGSKGSAGVVFRLDPPVSGSGPWTFVALHAFSYERGGHYKYNGQAGFIQNGLTFGPNRFLFGVATDGGLNDAGTVFAQTPH